MLVKKPIVPSHPNAYRSSQWTRTPSPTKRQKRPMNSIGFSKTRKASQPQRKARTSRPTSRPPEKLIKTMAQSRDVDDNTRDIHLIQQALEEFKTQRDQFVHSLGGLQRKLLKFRIPNLFASTVAVDELAVKTKPLPAPAEKKNNKKPAENSTEKPKDKKSRKEVRSVSQHFYLADMTESEMTSPSSSSSSDGSRGGDASEIELAKRKVNKFLDYDLIPIQPPETRRPEKPNPLLNQVQGRKTAAKKSPKPASGKPLNAQLTQLRRGVSELVKCMPSKVEAGKQNTAVESTQRGAGVESSLKTDGSWTHPLSPQTRAAVTCEFKRLKKASEMKLRSKLKKL